MHDRGERVKRIAFAEPQALGDYCAQEAVTLVIEYRDEHGKQRQVTLAGESLGELGSYFSKDDVMAYFRKEGIFYEVKAEWLQK